MWTRQRVERTIGRLVRNYRLGAYGDTLFWDCVLDVAGVAEPEHVVWALPDDLREYLVWWVRGKASSNDAYAEATRTPGFRKLHKHLT